jgi:hypothetical protein
VTLLLNSKPYLHSTTLETWNQWLETLDRESARTSRIVTAVRFDGVDEPAFRADAVRERRLGDYAVVEVETAPRRAFVASTLRQGAAMVTSLGDAAEATAQAFRETDIEEGHEMLPRLIEGIRGAVALTDECAAALGVPQRMMVCRDRPFEQWMEEFGRRLAVLLEARHERDWLTVADSLEYEIAPALREWASTFEQLAETATA